MIRKSVAFILVGIVIFNLSVGVIVNADPLEDRIRQHEESITNTQYKLNEYELKEQEIVTKLQELDNKIETSYYNITMIEQKVKETNLKIEASELKIKEYKEKIEQERKKIDTYLKMIYKEGVPPFMQILFNSDGITSLIDGIKAYSVLANRNKETMNSLDELVNVFQNEEIELETSKTFLENSKSEILLLTKELESDKEAQNTKLEDLSEIRIHLSEKIAQEQENINKIMLEIEEQRRIEEEQRRIEQEKKLEEQRILEEQRRIEEEKRLEEESYINNPTSSIPETNITAPSTPSISGVTGLDVVSVASRYLGIPYVWGGTTPSPGFDCSGLVLYVYNSLGYYGLPRVSQDQQYYGTDVSLNNLQPGDLLFFGRPATHVAIYVKDGYMLHAPTTGDVVKIQAVNLSTVTSAKRIIN